MKFSRRKVMVLGVGIVVPRVTQESIDLRNNGCRPCGRGEQGKPREESELMESGRK